ncbi:carboxypeptidase regulatory-like domain-containing protein [Paraflavitalea speifideaquila]|uniref:carboxypeptidase regulatory-like domain-containing protein n=1 Tax=Paraflavitalea speifideaquila TaxID=3076558 RepID=UPI0028E3D5F8|nr:carboxypeptidase regulatory-like domain-containing protein [Paraflavitalea speifideiaquila]
MEKKLFLAPRVLYRTRPWWCFPLFVLFSLFLYSPAQAQSRQITGSVADAKGNPLMGVTVNLKGTKTSVTTGVDGKYTIPVTGGTPVLSLPM